MIREIATASKLVTRTTSFGSAEGRRRSHEHVSDLTESRRRDPQTRRRARLRSGIQILKRECREAPWVGVDRGVEIQVAGIEMEQQYGGVGISDKGSGVRVKVDLVFMAVRVSSVVPIDDRPVGRINVWPLPQLDPSPRVRHRDAVEDSRIGSGRGLLRVPPCLHNARLPQPPQRLSTRAAVDVERRLCVRD